MTTAPKVGVIRRWLALLARRFLNIHADPMEMEGWISIENSLDIPAGDYLVTDGENIWISFRSRKSGGWWARKNGGGYGRDNKARFYMPKVTMEAREALPAITSLE